MRHALLAALVLGFAAPAAAAGGISLTLDEVHTVTFPAPVATVYVGNPSIADINMIDSRHAFVLGKAYGSTNIIALNHDGRQVSDTHISVMGNRQASVTVQRGVQRSTYDCTQSNCELTPQPGDGKDVYDQANSQIGAHQEAARKAAGVQ